MKNTLSGFRKYLEDMDPSPEKTRDTAMGGGSSDKGDTEDYFGALGDEEGIEWNDLVNVLQDEPWVSAHFGLKGPNGKQVLHKLSAWEIVKGSMTPNGADIRLKPQQGDRTYLHGNKLDKSDYKDDKRYHLNREELIKFMTTGWQPAVQQAQSGGMGGGMGGM